MKVSISIGEWAQMLRISFKDISRASTARVKPSSASALTPSMLLTDICVLAWSGRSGTVSCATFATPRSCTRMASAPAS